MPDPVSGHSKRRRPSLRPIAITAAMVVVLVISAPTLAGVYGQLDRTITLDSGWLVAIAAAEALQLCAVWFMLRVLLGTAGWFDVAASQLAGDAASNLVPGAALSGAGLQTTMMLRSGFDATRIVTAFAALAALTAVPTLILAPLAALTSVVLDTDIERRLLGPLWLGLGTLIVLLCVAVVSARRNRPWIAIARMVTAVKRRFGRPGDAAELGQRLLQERDQMRLAVRQRAGLLIGVSIARTALDCLALFMAVRAVGVELDLTSALVVFIVGELAGRVPLTPAGLGFVETGLAETLQISGVAAEPALLAVATYRMAATWLPTTAGLIAFALFERRHRGGGTSVEADAASGGPL